MHLIRDACGDNKYIWLLSVTLAILDIITEPHIEPILLQNPRALLLLTLYGVQIIRYKCYRVGNNGFSFSECQVADVY